MMAMSKPLQEVSTFLDNYWNRDQVFRTLQFTSTLCAGALDQRLPVASARFAALASSVSSMRTTLRLLDDIPNLAQTLAGWKRPKDSSVVLKIADFLSSLSGLLYYPTEHLAWATDLKILPFKSSSTLELLHRAVDDFSRLFVRP
ncbi:Peroxisomal membrane protein 11C [Geodia barretti]|uniref:Peroxisomal membrane protein 11C n=1 Tax=Geodia barretti TaxID=519541 RepID=A0AA35WFQ9_GEOBA|nr:Peroxisomal membrane protein 11C [Geodia barretti]